MGGAVSATTITTCGNYSLSSGSHTINVIAGPNSTITNGACVYINYSASLTSTGNINITNLMNNRSAATIGLYISDKGDGNNYININGNGAISGFNQGIYFYGDDSGLSTCTETPPQVTINSSLAIANTTYPFKAQTATVKCSNQFGIAFSLYFKAYNTTTYTFINHSASTLTLSPAATQLAPALTTVNTSIPLFTSNKLIMLNGNMTLNGTIVQNGVSFNVAGQPSYSTDIAGYWYLSKPVVFYNYSSGVDTWDVTSASLAMNGKEYYCVGGLCNPYYFSNDLIPLHVNVPDTLVGVKLYEQYTSLRIRWIQGMTNFYVASSRDNQDRYFQLQPNGQYIFELCNSTNCTNTTVLNSCPNAYVICQLFISDNGIYVLAPITNLNAMWQDVSYTVSFNPALDYGYIGQNDTNITFTIISRENALQYYGMRVDRYINYSTTTIYNQNDTNASGGTLVVPTNGSGKYIIYVWFKHRDFAQYSAPPENIWIGVQSGLGALATTLQSGLLVDGWTYCLIAFFITVVTITFVARYTIDGAGIAGLVVYWIMALLYPTAEFFSGGNMMTVGVLFTVIVGASYVLRSYI